MPNDNPERDTEMEDDARPSLASRMINCIAFLPTITFRLGWLGVTRKSEGQKKSNAPARGGSTRSDLEIRNRTANLV